jgi:opacity protein-like surface antigen
LASRLLRHWGGLLYERRRKMKSARVRFVLGLAGLFIAAAPVLAQPYPPPPPPYHRGGDADRFGEFRIWAGGFQPDAHGDYWDNKFRDFTGSKSDLRDVIVGGDFIIHLDRINAIMFSASYYSTTTTQGYRNFLDQNNNRIFHNTDYDIGSGTVAYVLFPAGTHTPVIPYLGAGVGIYGWRLREAGDFIDFSNNNAIFSTVNSDSGTAFGYFFLAGLEVPVTRHMALLIDGRYTKSHDNLGRDFAGFGRLDLSGGQVVGGLAFHL